MFRTSRSLKLSLLLGGALSLSACGDDKTSPPSTTDSLDQALVVNFADAVVVPTYNKLATRITELDAAVAALKADPSAAKLKAAQDAWVAARLPWEQSESFLFGPVTSYQFDPALDSWPVNRTDLDAVLANNNALTPAYVDNLDEAQKGFHTVEYLLFGENRTRKETDFNARQFEYLLAITANMKGISSQLASAWTTGKDGNAPYRNTLATAGDKTNTAYPTVESAAQEMLTGIVGILDEVANGKIADPYDAKDPNLVESQFALNSLSDFSNNIRSVQNVYLGHLPDETTTGTTLTSVVQEKDAALDARVRQEITDAIAALGQVPEPFPVSIKDPAAAPRIEAAQAAIRKLHDTFEKDVKKIVLP
ncbi:peptidase M75 [Corallococcus sp. H22C18031201]|uniref:imelysin family protein n=1 Tax=Citreicoccus inhibens TaxID=2849499 RepID=UPI000E725F98|nr:imelysin family protein [Citreicoccus inhibens]MBU8898266.1 peptidase M75 [Citreicoccus inhibens]RJS26995.1 peptidase M75 [Corallococcus sp. H22C18031201]